jgi:hypothetical protein
MTNDIRLVLSWLKDALANIPCDKLRPFTSESAISTSQSPSQIVLKGSTHVGSLRINHVHLENI